MNKLKTLSIKPGAPKLRISSPTIKVRPYNFKPFDLKREIRPE